jgi:DNA topoisomerase I
LAKATEHEEAAIRAGLVYVTDGLPGITRKRAGKGWSFYRPSGKLISDSKERKRILSLVIPPAWTDVWVCPDRKGHIQVTARDVKGRKQYRYHPDYRDARDQSKFKRIFEFSEVLPRMRGRAEKDLKAPENSRRQILATAVTLLDKTLIRVGNEDYAKVNQHYGLTTLRRKHVEVDGSELRFSFQGKSGVQHALSVKDKRIAKIIQRQQDLPGHELFKYLDEKGKRHTVTSDDVNEYLQEISGAHVTAKDFRTWGGTMMAGVALRFVGPAKTQRQATTNINKAIDAVSELLGNTRTVCKKYYVHPALIEAYMDGKVASEPEDIPKKKTQRSNTPALRRDEVAVLQFLDDLS